MALGELLFPLRYTPLYQGATVPGGKLRFHRTGTTTDMDTYSDSALGVANANPVVLDASGSLDTKVYGNPSSGFDYRVRLYTSADVLLWTEDDVVVPSRDVATIVEGSFTGTLTGMTAATTGTVTYKIIADDAGTGKVCILRSAAAILGTSNTTGMTMTGLPAACSPTTATRLLCEVSDSSNALLAGAVISASGTTITFTIDQPFSDTGFTGSGSKGLFAGWQIMYAL